MKTSFCLPGLFLLVAATAAVAQDAPAKPAATKPAAAPAAAPAATSTAKPFAPAPRSTATVSETRRSAESLKLEEPDSLYDLLIAERLSLGVNYISTSMDSTHVPYDRTQTANFLGNINNLSEDDMDGFGFVARYDLCRFVALQLSTGTHIELGMWNNEHESRDANFVADGTTYEVLLMCPIDSIYTTLFVGLGMTSFSCEIDYNNWWHYGWDSPKSYEKYGKGSKEDRNGTSRWMKLTEPSSAFSFTAGVSVRLWRHVDADVFYRMIDMDDCKIEFDRKEGANSHKMRDGHIPLKCSSYGVALRAVF